ncbi:MAG TPA: tetratricopeptide repeat protein [Haliangiales bacterium]|nr:tetratricopeptide repeat protein [Haliangiales bacterium]
MPVVVVLLVANVAEAKLGEIVRAARTMEEGRIEDARPLVQALVAASPDEPEVRYLQGHLAFLEGDYDRSLAILDKLKDTRVKAEAGELETLVARTRAVTRGFVPKESPAGHFVFYYAPGRDEAIVDWAAEALDAAYQRIGEDLGYFPPEKVRVEIIGRPRDLAQLSTLTEKDIDTSGTIALCKYNKLMVVSPRATIFGYPWMDTLAHEYTHFVVTRATSDRMPIWLHEGLAKFQEVRWRGEPGEGGLGRSLEHLLATALRKRRLITFEQMHPSMALLPSQEAAATAFAEVYTYVAWLHKKLGYDGIRSILARIRDGKSERRAVSEVLGVTWERAEIGWKRHLRSLGLRSDPSIRVHRLRFERGDVDDENAGLDAVVEEKARKFARLGGLLRARGRLAGAAAEYEKARAAAPDDGFIGAKLARTYLELDQAQKAIDVAGPLAQKDPEDVGPQATLGAAFLKVGDATGAEKHLLAALRVSPFDPAVRCGLAQTFRDKGDTVRAEREQKACDLLRRRD